VGCGAISHSWAEAYRDIDAFEIVGYVDLDEERAQAFAEKYKPGTPVFTDFRTAMAETGAEVVVEAVVPAARKALVLAAFEQGCDVISAKPLAQDLAEAAEVVREARRLGRLHAVVQNLRYSTGARRMEQFLRSGAIGEVVEAHCDFFIGAHFDGFRAEMQHVLLHDMAVHNFDLARLFARENPAFVYCRSRNPPNSWFKDGAAAAAIFEMPSGGVFSFRGSWCAEGLRTPWTGSWRLVGTKGSVIWEDDDRFRAQVATTEMEGILAKLLDVDVPEYTKAQGTGGAGGVFRDFVAAKLNGTVPETVASDNFHTFAMVTAAIESAQTGTRVPVDPGVV